MAEPKKNTVPPLSKPVSTIAHPAPAAMDKPPVKVKSFTSAHASQRGMLMDELHGRIDAIKAQRKIAPAAWHELLGVLAETSDPAVIEDAVKFISALPPREYHTAEITWDTFKQFSRELRQAIVVYADEIRLIGGTVDLMSSIDALIAIRGIKGKTELPSEAMKELARIRSQFIAMNPDFTE